MFHVKCCLLSATIANVSREMLKRNDVAQSNSSKQSQVKAFFFPHFPSLFVSIVGVAHQVQDPVNDDAVQFMEKRNGINRGILTDPVNADENVAFHALGTVRLVERNDVRKIVMLQIFPVHLKQIIVRTKNNV